MKPSKKTSLTNTQREVKKLWCDIRYILHEGMGMTGCYGPDGYDCRLRFRARSEDLRKLLEDTFRVKLWRTPR